MAIEGTATAIVSSTLGIIAAGAGILYGRVHKRRYEMVAPLITLLRDASLRQNEGWRGVVDFLMERADPATQQLVVLRLKRMVEDEEARLQSAEQAVKQAVRQEQGQAR